MPARFLVAAVNGIEVFSVEVEVNSGWGRYHRRNHRLQNT